MYDEAGIAIVEVPEAGDEIDPDARCRIGVGLARGRLPLEAKRSVRRGVRVRAGALERDGRAVSERRQVSESRG